jgi:hypothetical protein
MSKLAKWVVAGASVAALVGVLAIVRSAREQPRRAAVATMPVPPPAPAAAPAPAVPPAAPKAAPAPAPAPPPPRAARRPPERGSPEPVVHGESLRSLGPVGVQLLNGLNGVRGQLAACLDRDRRAGIGRTSPAQGRMAVPPQRVGRPVLVLEVETLPGAVRILDAPVVDRQGASDGLVDCAQGVLRGLTVRAPAAQPGARHRVQYSM